MTGILFANARIIDGTGIQPFAGEVLVVGQRIVAIVASGKLAVSPSTRTVDCAGATLMPGLVEPHAHLSFVDQATPHAFSTLPIEEHLLLTVRHARLYLDQGFTACFSAAATKPRLDVVVRNAINAGEIPGPRLLAASVQLTVTGGVGDLRDAHNDPGEAMYTRPCDGALEFRKAAREVCRDGVDIIKIVPSGDTSTPAIPSGQTLMTEEEIAAVADVARRHGRRLAAHARSAEAVQLCVRHGVDVIYHATFADEKARDMLEEAKARVFVAPALGVTEQGAHHART